MNARIVVLFLMVSALMYAQKSEISNALKQIESKNYKGALITLQSVKKGYDFSALTTDEKKDYYYSLGTANLENGNVLEAAKAYVEVNKLESMPTYWVKDKSTKEKKYFTNKEEAETFANEVSGNVKELPPVSTYSAQINLALNNQLQAAVEKGNNFYNNKDYESASTQYEEGYYIMEALNLDGEQYLYNGAISAYQGDDFQKAKRLFDAILSQSKAGNAKFDPFLEDTYRLNAYISMKAEDWETAKKWAEEGLEKFPNNDELNTVLVTVLNNSGDDEALIEQLKEKVKKDPNDAVSFYNLGVLYSRDDAMFDQSLENFKKATDIDTAYGDAYQNIARLLVQKDKEFVDTINALGTTQNDADKEEQIEAERNAFHRSLVPYMEKAHNLSPDDKSYIQILKFSYGLLNDDTNYKKYDALLR